MYFTLWTHTKTQGKEGPRSKFICLNVKIHLSEGKPAAALSYTTKNNYPQKTLSLTIPPSYTCRHYLMKALLALTIYNISSTEKLI